MADVALRFQKHRPVQFRADKFTAADITEHIQVKAAPTGHIQNQVIILRINPLENRPHALFEGHVRLIARHPFKRLLVNAARIHGRFAHSHQPSP
jgi:hypothetical protein